MTTIQCSLCRQWIICILHTTVLSLKDPQIRETKVPWGGHPDPKGNLKGIKYICVNVYINFTLLVTATINDKVFVLLVDIGLALTILHRDTWEKCKEPQQQLLPWCKSWLVLKEVSYVYLDLLWSS